MIETADYKVTALFCVIDDFCKQFESENAGLYLVFCCWLACWKSKLIQLFISVLNSVKFITQFNEFTTKIQLKTDYL